MSAYVPTASGPVHVLHTIWTYRWRFLATALAVWSLAVVYLLIRVRPWEASQGVVVQGDALSTFGLSSHNPQERERKDGQQTLMELGRSRSLLRGVLEQVGPPIPQTNPLTARIQPLANAVQPVLDRAKHWMPAERSPAAATAWPSEEAIDELRSAVAFGPPKGEEFGRTDVFYLRARDPDRGRALALVDALYENLERSFRKLRVTTIRNSLVECRQSVALAEANLADSTRRMAKMEEQAGVDLIALRMLNQLPNSDTALYRNLANSVDELRQVRATESNYTNVIKLLELAQTRPESLQAGPREAIDAHPALGRLIQGLSDSRLKSSALAGRLTERDPELAAARREEREIRGDIGRELDQAIRSVTAMRDLASARRTLLETHVADMQKRVDRLATIRAEYANTVSQTEQRAKLLDDARKELSQAQAAEAATEQGKLLARIDSPDAGARPVGPGRFTLLLAGVLGGVLAGVAMVYLTAPLPQPLPIPYRRQSRLRREPKGLLAVRSLPSGNGHHDKEN